jgi:Fungal specific transcription factor domain
MHQAPSLGAFSLNKDQSTRLLELRLFYNYVSLSCLIQAPQPQCSHIYQTMNALAQLAFTSPVLMDALLSISALSFRTLNPADHVMDQVSYNYALRATRECSRQIRDGVSESNAEGLFLASMLIAFHGFASRHHVKNSSSSGSDMRLLQWFRLFQGVRAVKEAGRPWIQNSGPLQDISESLPARLSARSAAREAQLFAFLLEGLDQGDDVDADTKAAYEDAVRYLSFVLGDAQLRGLLGFPVAVSSRFVDLLDGRDPRALAIVGNWLALMRISHLSRFLSGAREKELDEIMCE